jgi:hypothetical protein
MRQLQEMLLLQNTTLSITKPSESLHQLPPDTKPFINRTNEIKKIEDAITEGTSNVFTICGMPGVGKETLANHVAHMFKDKFPDHALYADLREADSYTVLGNWLSESGKYLHSNIKERAKTYRSLLKGKRVLVLLVNASNEEQVKYLLPDDSLYLVLITSHQPLSSQKISACPIDLEELNPTDARLLLESCIKRRPERWKDEPKAAEDIVKSCGYLPIVITSVGGTLDTNDHLSLGDYLADKRGLENEVTAYFRQCYEAIDDPEARQLFRFLHLLPQTFSKEVAAELIGRPDISSELALLIRLRLVKSLGSTCKRYQIHESHHEFAGKRLDAENSREEIESARQRVIVYFLRQSSRMNDQLDLDERRKIAKDKIAKNKTLSQEEIEQELEKEALQWFEKELPTLDSITKWIEDSL